MNAEIRRLIKNETPPGKGEILQEISATIEALYYGVAGPKKYEGGPEDTRLLACLVKAHDLIEEMPQWKE